MNHHGLPSIRRNLPTLHDHRLLQLQSKDKDAQVFFKNNLNHVMARHGMLKPHFIGFMANSAQTHWNAMRIIYGSGDPKVPIDGRKRTCYFHWTQSLEKHTKLYIKHDLHDQHKRINLQYIYASSMLEEGMRYLAIKAWWASSSYTSEEGLKHLQLWLAFSRQIHSQKMASNARQQGRQSVCSHCV